MSKPFSLFSALLCTFIWGTTFIAQDTGMDNIGPFTFNAVRFFVGFLAITPLVILFELKNFKPELKTDKKTFVINVSLIGLSLFLGSALQQVALLYTDVANAAFFTIFYVPMVPIIIYLFGKKSIHWSVWPLDVRLTALTPRGEVVLSEGGSTPLTGRAGASQDKYLRNTSEGIRCFYSSNTTHTGRGDNYFLPSENSEPVNQFEEFHQTPHGQ